MRGGCPHSHRTFDSAARCADRDQRACRKAGGGSYSDRTVRYIVHAAEAGQSGYLACEHGIAEGCGAPGCEAAQSFAWGIVTDDDLRDLALQARLEGDEVGVSLARRALSGGQVARLQLVRSVRAARREAREQMQDAPEPAWVPDGAAVLS